MAKEPKVHKGAPRRYWCPHHLDAKGQLLVRQTQTIHPISPGCSDSVVRDGEAVPRCVAHGLLMKTSRFKRVEEREWERRSKAQMTIGMMSVWQDTARRKAKCHLCFGVIEHGEKRIAFEAATRTAIKTMAGGVIKSSRQYVHSTCFTDVIMGGTPGEGCPGCSAKMLNDEFQAVRKQLAKRHG